MPSTSLPADKRAADRDARRARVARLDRLATSLDARFRIPGLGIPIGWDSILGLIPGLGDAATAVPGAAMIYEAHRLGARNRAKLRMAANTGVDLVFGSIPLVGDLFDLVFKSHRRNIRILKHELARIEAQEEEETQWQSDTDPRMDKATASGLSQAKPRPDNKADPAAHFSATSPHATSASGQPKNRRA